MKIIVNPHTIEIDKEETINEGEYNIQSCQFEFSKEYEELTKEAVFTANGETTKVAILNDECTIPGEVLQQRGNVLLGVFGYETENNELKLRYSPTAKHFNVANGSYKEGNDPELPEPTEWERVLELINEAITETNNLNIEVNKADKITTITLTKKDGTTKTVQVEDGKDGASLESIEIVDKNLIVVYGGETHNLGQVASNIQVGTTTTGMPGTSASVVNTGTDLNPVLEFTIPRGEAGAIKMQIVDTLPTTGEEETIYLVPLETPDTQSNNYAEYIWINNQWELLGKIGVQVDLTDYYTKGEVNVLLNAKQPLIDNNNKLPYSLISGTPTIPSKTSDLTNDSNFVSNTDYASTSVAGVIKVNASAGSIVNSSGQIVAYTRTYAQYQDAYNDLFIGKGTLEAVITGKELVNKTYVDGLVGDINTALDTINGEVI
jgi:hypothetical protein